MPPARLGAYLREFEALMDAHGVTACPTATSATAACTCGSTCRWSDRRRGVPRVRRRRRATGRAARRVAVRRARRRPGPQRAAAAHVLRRRRSTLFARGQGAVRPGRPAQPGRPRRARPARRRPAPAAGRPAARRRRLGFAYPTTAGISPRPCTAASGSASAGPTPRGAGGFMCPSYLATGDEKDSTRGRARVLQELANGTLVDRRLVGRAEVHEALDLCLSCKACASRLPGRGGHGPVQGGGAAPALPAPAATGRALQRWAGCRAGLA